MTIETFKQAEEIYDKIRNLELKIKEYNRVINANNDIYVKISFE